MSPEQLDEARRYGHLQLICSLLDRALDMAFLAAFAVWGAQPLEEWLACGGMPGGRWACLAGVFLGMTGLHMAVSFPLSCYSGYRLEHRFGLSRLTFMRWLRRYAKRNILSTGFGLALVVGLYAIVWSIGPWWWLVAGGAAFFVSVVVGQLFPVVVLPLFYKLEPLDSPELLQRLQKLVAGTGLRVSRIERIGLSAETVKANAMLAGLGGTRRVILGDTLLDRFSPEEIEVVFAHEVGHHVHRHMAKMLGAGLVLTLSGFWLVDQLLLGWVEAAGGPADYSSLPAWSLAPLMLILTLFFQLLEPLQNALSRRHERQADGYALRHVASVEAYRSAFAKLARINKDDPSPHWLEVALFHSHPPIADRLRMADRPVGVPPSGGMPS